VKTPPRQTQVNIKIPPDLDATYSNLALITHSASEIIIDFARVLPNTPQAKVYARIITTPLHAKLLLRALGENLEKYKNELLTERQRLAKIKQKYGFQSLEYLIVKLDGELITLYDRQERGDNVDLVIRNKEERKSAYEKALAELKIQLEKEKSLTMSLPSFKGIIRVLPQALAESSMRNDPEVERIGMEMAMAFEKAHNRIPEDVSAENLGFDIRSKDPRTETIRYIEVKARAQTASVALTQNEWFKAKRFKNDYYLYAVMPTSKNPQLYIIQNPAETLQAEEKVEIVRYLISAINSISTGAPSGSSKTPIAFLECFPSSPHISTIRSDAPFTTAGW
jgi:hypothetical protein